MDLVDEQQLAVGAETELVLRVGQDQARLRRHLLAAAEHAEGGRRHPVPQLGLDEPALDHLGTRQRLVVHGRAGRRLGGRRDQRLGQGGVLRQPVGEVVAVDRPGAVGVLPPQRRRRDAGDVAAHDDLDRQRRRRLGHEHVGVGQGDDVVGHDVGGLGEPPRGELVEDLALVPHAGDDPVERREAIGRDEQAVTVAEGVGHAHLADPAIGQRQVDVDERGDGEIT